MLGTLASSRRIPESTVQINCVAMSLLSGFGTGVGVGLGAGVGAREEGVAGDACRVGDGPITNGDCGVGSGESEGTAAGTDGVAGAVSGDAGVQPAAINNASNRGTAIAFILLFPERLADPKRKYICQHVPHTDLIFVFPGTQFNRLPPGVTVKA